MGVNMKAVFKLIADNEDITNLLQDRLLSINITDEYGLVSDSLTIELDDRDNVFSIPDCGASLEVFLGYAADNLYNMGKYVVDEVELSGPPHKLSITARASNSNEKENMGNFTAARTFSWSTHTILGIVRKIAQRYGLQDAVGEDFMHVVINHMDQTSESDASFLQRLARDHGAIIKIAGGKLMFFTPSRGTFPDGTPLPTIELDMEKMSNYQMRLSERGRYKRVIAKYYDLEEAEEKQVEVGTGEPAFILREVSTSAELAKKRARAKLEEVKKGTYTLSLQMEGNPLISAESRIELKNTRDELKGIWIVKQTRHSFNSSGFITNLEATRPLE